MLELNKIAKQYYPVTNTFRFIKRSPLLAVLLTLYVIGIILFLLHADTLLGVITKLSAMVVVLGTALVLLPYALALAQSNAISHFNRENLVPGKSFGDGDYTLARKQYLEHLLIPKFGKNLPQALETIDKLRQIDQRNPVLTGEQGFARWIYTPEAKGRIVTLLSIVISVALAIFVARSPETANELFERIFSAFAEPLYWAVLVLLTLLLAMIFVTLWMFSMLGQSILLMLGVQSYAVRILINDCYRYAYASEETLRDDSKLPRFAAQSIVLITKLSERTRQVLGGR